MDAVSSRIQCAIRSSAPYDFRLHENIAPYLRSYPVWLSLKIPLHGRTHPVYHTRASRLHVSCGWRRVGARDLYIIPCVMLCDRKSRRRRGRVINRTGSLARVKVGRGEGGIDHQDRLATRTTASGDDRITRRSYETSESLWTGPVVVGIRLRHSAIILWWLI